MFLAVCFKMRSNSARRSEMDQKAKIRVRRVGSNRLRQKERGRERNYWSWKAVLPVDTGHSPRSGTTPEREAIFISPFMCVCVCVFVSAPRERNGHQPLCTLHLQPGKSCTDGFLDRSTPDACKETHACSVCGKKWTQGGVKACKHRLESKAHHKAENLLRNDG